MLVLVLVLPVDVFMEFSSARYLICQQGEMRVESEACCQLSRPTNLNQLESNDDDIVRLKIGMADMELMEGQALPWHFHL